MYTGREFCFKIYPEILIVCVQYNILKIFTTWVKLMHLSKIN